MADDDNYGSAAEWRRVAVEHAPGVYYFYKRKSGAPPYVTWTQPPFPLEQIKLVAQKPRSAVCASLDASCVSAADADCGPRVDATPPRAAQAAARLRAGLRDIVRSTGAADARQSAFEPVGASPAAACGRSSDDAAWSTPPTAISPVPHVDNTLGDATAGIDKFFVDGSAAASAISTPIRAKLAGGRAVATAAGVAAQAGATPSALQQTAQPQVSPIVRLPAASPPGLPLLTTVLAGTPSHASSRKSSPAAAAHHHAMRVHHGCHEASRAQVLQEADEVVAGQTPALASAVTAVDAEPLSRGAAAMPAPVALDQPGAATHTRGVHTNQPIVEPASPPRLSASVDSSGAAAASVSLVARAAPPTRPMPLARALQFESTSVDASAEGAGAVPAASVPAPADETGAVAPQPAESSGDGAPDAHARSYASVAAASPSDLDVTTVVHSSLATLRKRLQRGQARRSPSTQPPAAPEPSSGLHKQAAASIAVTPAKHDAVSIPILIAMEAPVACASCGDIFKGAGALCEHLVSCGTWLRSLQGLAGSNSHTLPTRDPAASFSAPDGPPASRIPVASRRVNRWMPATPPLQGDTAQAAPVQTAAAHTARTPPPSRIPRLAQRATDSAAPRLATTAPAAVAVRVHAAVPHHGWSSLDGDDAASASGSATDTSGVWAGSQALSRLPFHVDSTLLDLQDSFDGDSIMHLHAHASRAGSGRIAAGRPPATAALPAAGAASPPQEPALQQRSQSAPGTRTPTAVAATSRRAVAAEARTLRALQRHARRKALLSEFTSRPHADHSASADPGHEHSMVVDTTINRSHASRPGAGGDATTARSPATDRERSRATVVPAEDANNSALTVVNATFVVDDRPIKASPTLSCPMCDRPQPRDALWTHIAGCNGPLGEQADATATASVVRSRAATPPPKASAKRTAASEHRAPVHAATPDAALAASAAQPTSAASVPLSPVALSAPPAAPVPAMPAASSTTHQRALLLDKVQQALSLAATVASANTTVANGTTAEAVASTHASCRADHDVTGQHAGLQRTGAPAQPSATVMPCRWLGPAVTAPVTPAVAVALHDVLRPSTAPRLVAAVANALSVRPHTVGSP